MKRNLLIATGAISLSIIGIGISAASAFDQAHSRAQRDNAGAAQAEQARAQQEAARNAQAERERSLRANEDQARNAQSEAQQRQAEASKQQRSAQDNFAREQKQQQGQMQQQQRMQQQQMQAAQNAQKEQARQAQQMQQQERAASEQRQVRSEGNFVHEQNATRAESFAAPARAENFAPPAHIAAREHGGNMFAKAQYHGATIPLQNAFKLPEFEPNITAAEQEHAQMYNTNLRNHLIAIAASEIPQSWPSLQQTYLNNYLGNYSCNLANQVVNITPQNTFVTAVPQWEYPSWWHPTPGWIFSNGFTLGNVVTAALDWFKWGWHPYYGPPPEGFVCAANYAPTPWIYYPGYGLWREAGAMAWAPAGPPPYYDAPISVEVIEPRHIKVSDFWGHNTEHIMNVPYLYDAFYDPQVGLWGYTNRHGNFLWVNF